MKSILAAGLFLSALAAHAQDTTRYSVYVNGGTANAGHEYVTRDGDGGTKVDFVFKNNGRGPQLKEEFKVDKDGTFVRYHVVGTSTFGAAIDESFQRVGDKAQWKSTSDKGEQDVFGPALYTPLGGTPESLAVAIAALAKRSDGK
ncbi:MAG TPA: amidohydrolase, partial [Rudaea sp.]